MSCRMQLAHPELVNTRDSQNIKQLIGYMLNIFGIVVFMGKVPAGCSKLAKGLYS